MRNRIRSNLSLYKDKLQNKLTGFNTPPKKLSEVFELLDIGPKNKLTLSPPAKNKLTTKHQVTQQDGSMNSKDDKSRPESTSKIVTHCPFGPCKNKIIYTGYQNVICWMTNERSK